MKVVSARLPHKSTAAPSDRPCVRSPQNARAQNGSNTLEAWKKDIRAAQFRSLLVPLDGSLAAEHAIPWALDIARRSGGSLRLVYVHQVPRATPRRWPIGDGNAYDRRRQELHLEYFVGVAERISRISAVPVAPLVLEDSNVAESLADAGRSSDMVVMATRRRGAIGRLFGGSVVTQLLRRTTLPLLIAPGYKYPVGRALPKSIRRVLIPLDGSANNEAILDAASELSSLTAAECGLLRVVPRRPYAGTPWNEKEDEALSYLNRVAARLRRRPSAVHTEIVSSDEAVGEVILANAQASDSDLIALTSTRRGGLADGFERSPVSYLLGKAHLPILVMRAARQTTDDNALGLGREGQSLVDANVRRTVFLDGQ